MTIGAREWLLRLECHPPMWRDLLESCGLAIGAHTLARAKLRVLSPTHDPGPPKPRELYAAALEIAQRANHDGPIPLDHQLADECEHAGLRVIR